MLLKNMKRFLAFFLFLIFISSIFYAQEFNETQNQTTQNQSYGNDTNQEENFNQTDLNQSQENFTSKLNDTLDDTQNQTDKLNTFISSLEEKKLKEKYQELKKQKKKIEIDVLKNIKELGSLFVLKKTEYEKDIGYIKGNKDIAGFEENFYLSLWFKTNSENQMILLSEYSKYKNIYYEVWLTTEGNIYFVLTDGENEISYETDKNNYKDGGWHLLVLTKNQNKIKIYVDGERIFEKESQLILDKNTEFLIGAGLEDRIQHPYAQFDGILKNIEVTSIELDEEDVKYEYLMADEK